MLMSFWPVSTGHFATADDELRPVMGGIFIEASTDNITFVASDAHKLVRYQRADAHAEADASFILRRNLLHCLKIYCQRRKAL